MWIVLAFRQGKVPGVLRELAGKRENYTLCLSTGGNAFILLRRSTGRRAGLKGRIAADQGPKISHDTGVSFSTLRSSLRPTTSSILDGDTPVPGRFATSISRLITVDAATADLKARLFLRTSRFDLSEGAGCFNPSPRAASTFRIALTN